MKRIGASKQSLRAPEFLNVFLTVVPGGVGLFLAVISRLVTTGIRRRCLLSVIETRNYM
jgi:hypothetical protein